MFKKPLSTTVPSLGTFARYQSLCPLHLDPYQAPGSNTWLSHPSHQGHCQVGVLWGHWRFAMRDPGAPVGTLHSIFASLILTFVQSSLHIVVHRVHGVQEWLSGGSGVSGANCHRQCW